MAENRLNSIQLHYLTPLGYPSRYANRLQVAKMSEAFSKEVGFTLYIKSAVDGIDNIFTDYGVEKFNIVEVGTSKMWPRSFWYAIRLNKIIKSLGEQDIFYCRDFLLTVWLIFLCPKFRNNFFFEIHSLGRFPEFIYRNIFKYAKGIISTNQRKADDVVRKYKVSREKIIVFGNGIDLDEFNSLPDRKILREGLGLTNKKTVLYAGTYSFSYGKDIVEGLKKIFPDLNFIVCTNKPRIEALKYMKACDILLAPYSAIDDRIKYLSSPIKVKEYMASGNSAIVSDIPSVREMATEHQVYFAKPDNLESFVEKMREILDNPQEAELRANKALDKVKEYSWSKRAGSILDFIINNI